MNPVVLENLIKNYGKVEALRGLNLSVKQGEILGLLGHNGSGKTTTMKLILGVIAASSGQVRLFGESPVGAQANHLRRACGYLPESVRFYEQLSGREVLDYFARLKGVPVVERKQLLQQVGLADAAQRRVKTYSKGMRQRLGLAQALLGKPRLLLLDEPTAGLDPAATQEFYATLDELRNQGVTVLLSSHVLPGIETHIDRAAILGGGRLLAEGTLDQLRQRANLPMTLRVRGSFKIEAWSAPLEPSGVSIKKINGTRFEVSIPECQKMELMRSLLCEPDVQDVEMVPASLEHLYAHYSRPGELPG